MEAILCWAVSAALLLLPAGKAPYRVNSLNIPVHTISSLDQGLTMSTQAVGAGRLHALLCDTQGEPGAQSVF